jgi:uncharacterized protein YciI
MSFFIITMTHPDGDSWNRHLTDHVSYLQKLVKDGILRASGPLKNMPHRTGCLIIFAASRHEVEAVVSRDPFAREGLIENLTILEWDPLFGIFAAESAGRWRLCLPRLVHQVSDLVH